MKEFVTGLLRKSLPSTYYYHCVEHTLYVADRVIEIAKFEKCSADEMDLLTAAALWHDAGFINTYLNHEEESCRLARKYLPGFGYKNTDIEKICGMIMATKIPQSPKNKLEEIISDADLEYLGTDLAENISNNLFEELHVLDPLLTREKWDEIQVSFLQKHHYFTSYCKENKAPRKAEYLNKLIKKSSG